MNERNGRWERYCLGFKVNKYNIFFKIKIYIYKYMYIYIKFIPILAIIGIKSLFQYYKNVTILIFIPVKNIIGIKDLTLFIKLLSASYFISGGFEQV